MMFDVNDMIDGLSWKRISFPAFRLMVFVNGVPTEEPARSACKTLTQSLFEEISTAFAATSFDLPNKRIHRVAKLNKGHLETIDESFNTPWEGNQGFRLYGNAITASEPTHRIGIPYFSLEQYEFADLNINDVNHMFVINLALPAEYPRASTIIDQSLNHVGHLNIASGASGLGFYTPLANEGIEFAIVSYLRRYRTAYPLSQQNLTHGLKYTTITKKRNPATKPGIAGVAWKTIVGKEFFDRLDVESLLNVGDAQVSIERCHDTIILTAGKEPIWGDVNLQEDISAYQKVGQWLRPVRFPDEILPVIGNDETLEDEKAYFDLLFEEDIMS